MSCLFSQIDYETEIQPIFNNNCISCHGSSSGLNLSSWDNLKIGGGLAAKLYQPRIYIGKSNYRSNFAVPTTEFSKEASPLRYKALRYKFRRRVRPLSNWIINRNQFDNSNLYSMLN